MRTAVQAIQETNCNHDTMHFVEIEWKGLEGKIDYSLIGLFFLNPVQFCDPLWSVLNAEQHYAKPTTKRRGSGKASTRRRDLLFAYLFEKHKEREDLGCTMLVCGDVTQSQEYHLIWAPHTGLITSNLICWFSQIQWFWAHSTDTGWMWRWVAHNFSFNMGSWRQEKRCSS